MGGSLVYTSTHQSTHNTALNGTNIEFIWKFGVKRFYHYFKVHFHPDLSCSDSGGLKWTHLLWMVALLG